MTSALTDTWTHETVGVGRGAVVYRQDAEGDCMRVSITVMKRHEQAGEERVYSVYTPTS